MKSKREELNIEGKVVALIGATGILGTQYVHFLSEKGAKVIIGDVNLETCNAYANEVKDAYGADCLPLHVDVYDESSIIKFYRNLMENYGKLDAVVNNSQVKPDGFYNSFENYSKETLMKVIEGNTVGLAISCREAGNIFLQQGYGSIINVASIYGVVGADQRLYDGVENIYNPEEKFTSPVSYAISKAGVVNMTKYLASYYREKNIRVNCLTPGGVYDNHDKTFNKNYSDRTLLGRMADRKEYNGAMLFLISDSSSYMTGSNLIIDGGWTAI